MVAEELMRKLQNREFGNIWGLGTANDWYDIYFKDGSHAYITEEDFCSISKIDEDLFDDMNRMLQN